jgi:hypothetical protein
MPWYQDPKVILPALLSLLAIATTIGLALYQQKRQRGEKTVDYEVVAQVRLLGNAKLPENLAAITVSGAKTRDPCFSVVRIRNTGRKPVRPEDFAAEPVISVEPGMVVAAVVGEASADRLRKGEPTVADGHISIPKMFLNASDWIEIAIISDGNPDEIGVDILINDASRPPIRIRSEQERETVARTAVSTMFSGIIAIVTAAITAYTAFVTR